MKKPINVIALTASNGTKTVAVTETMDDGNIIGFSIFTPDNMNNPGLVQASLECNGSEILPLHHIKNYRNRETAYHNGYIPINEQGGKRYTVNIVSDVNFTADTKFQAVFYYDLDNKSC